MSELLSGLVPGLPDELRASILRRAEGIPLYAVETVRMLLDRDLLERENGVYRPVGPIETLEVPETLQALIAARLDGLAHEERRLLEDAAVLGKVFTKQGLTALPGSPKPSSSGCSARSSARRCSRSRGIPARPSGGSTPSSRTSSSTSLTRRSRRRNASGSTLPQLLPLSLSSAEEDEAIEVVASHYLDAYSSSPDDPDAEEIRAKARETLVRAADRAASLAANLEAQRAYERAVELTDEPLMQGELHERAGAVAAIAARADEASAHFERSIALFEAAGATHSAAHVSARLAEIHWDRGRLEDGLESMESSLAVLAGEEPDEAVAALAAQVGRFRFFAGDLETASRQIETALGLAEALSLPEVLSEALNTKALVLICLGRQDEGSLLLRHALAVALEHDKPSAALRAFYNLADAGSSLTDRYEDAVDFVRQGLAHARRVGDRYQELLFLGQSVTRCSRLASWDEALDWAARASARTGCPSGRRTRPSRASASSVLRATRATSRRPSGWWRFSTISPRPRTRRSAPVTPAAALGCSWRAVMRARRCGSRRPRSTRATRWAWRRSTSRSPS